MFISHMTGLDVAPNVNRCFAVMYIISIDFVINHTGQVNNDFFSSAWALLLLLATKLLTEIY